MGAGHSLSPVWTSTWWSGGRTAVAGCTCRLPCRLQTRLQRGGRILCTSQRSTSAPVVLNAQGPACHSGFNYRKQGTLSTACFTPTEEPFAEAHPTKHGPERSMPWESTQAANGAFLLSTKAGTHGEAFFHLCVPVSRRNGSLAQCKVGSIVPCFSLTDWSYGPPELFSPHSIPSMLFPGPGRPAVVWVWFTS